MTKYQINFTNVNEIRMGSPYNICDLEVEGAFVPELPAKSFQDLAPINADGSVCYLVEWSLIKNSSGFKIWRLDGNLKNLSILPRFEGLCSEISTIGYKAVSFLNLKHDEISQKMLSEQKNYAFD